MKPICILLTGVTGYLGSRLATSLLANGYEVIGLKRKSSLLHRIETISSKLTLYDIEEVDISELFAMHCEIDTVIHTATCYGRNGESATQLLEANMSFPFKLLVAAVASGVELFMNTDTMLDKFLNPYALSKGQFAEWGRYFSRQKKMRFLNLKLEHFYGPGDDVSKFTTHVINSCLANVPELKLTLGEQQRDFIYIDDVVDAYLLLLSKQETFDNGFVEFDVGSGAAVTVREFVETVHRLIESTTRLDFGALPYRVGEAMFSQADTKALQTLGWHCRYSMETGLKQSINQQRKLI